MASSWYNPLSPNLVYKSRFIPAMPLYRRSHSSEIEWPLLLAIKKFHSSPVKWSTCWRRNHWETSPFYNKGDRDFWISNSIPLSPLVWLYHPILLIDFILYVNEFHISLSQLVQRRLIEDARRGIESIEGSFILPCFTDRQMGFFYSNSKVKRILIQIRIRATRWKSSCG